MKRKWSQVHLGEVLDERHEEPLPEDLESGRVRIVEKIVFNTGLIQLRSDVKTKTGMILVRPGDLLVSGINAAKGAIALYDMNNSEPIAATIHYSAYIPNQERVKVKFLWWMLRSRFFQERLLEYVPGGIKTELKAKRLLPVPVPLPSLEEQKRIVAIIEELSAQINEARTLRQQAVEEAEVLINNQLHAAFVSLVERHETIFLGQLISEAGYGSSEKCHSERSEGAVPVLRIPNVALERITLKDLKYALMSLRDRERLTLAKGDILVVRTNGSLDLIGRCAVVHELPEPMAFASYMIRLRLDQRRILPEYAQRMLGYLRTSGQLVDFARTTAGQYNISLGRLRSVEIPVPGLPEQYQIVAEWNELQAEVDGIKHIQTETAIELDALLPAILDKAFKGEI